MATSTRWTRRTGCVIWTFAPPRRCARPSWSRAGRPATRPRTRQPSSATWSATSTGSTPSTARCSGARRRTITRTRRLPASPSLHAGRLFVPVSSLEVVPAANPAYPCCTFRGSVVAYDAATGERLWQSYTITEPPTIERREQVRHGAVRPLRRADLEQSRDRRRAQPALRRHRRELLVAGDDGQRRDHRDGSRQPARIKWTFQATPRDAWNTACGQPNDDNCPDEDGPDFDFGAATVLAQASDGREFVLGGQKSGIVHALDPDTGKPIWQTRVGRGGIQGGVHFGMAVAGDRVLVPINDMQDGRTYPDPAQPGLHALDLRTGAMLWRQELTGETCAGSAVLQSGHLVRGHRHAESGARRRDGWRAADPRRRDRQAAVVVRHGTGIRHRCRACPRRGGFDRRRCGCRWSRTG